MPLSAYINGERQIAPLLDSSEWEALRATRPAIELGCCRSRGFMRVSKLGTQHFVHARRSDACTSAPESAEHLLLKSIILVAVRNASWDGDVEVCSQEGGWRADVMASKDRLRVAFEVQLSTIPFFELAARQQAYSDSGVRGCWFYGYGALNPPAPTKTDMPVFPFSYGINNPVAPSKRGMPPDQVRIGSHEMPLPEAVSALLNRQFRRCAKQHVTTSEGITIFRFHECWACHRDFDVFCPTQCSATCDDRLPADQSEDWITSPLKDAGAPWIIRKVQQYVAAHPEMNLMVTYPGWHWAQSSRRKHFTFCCFHCGALIASEIFEQLLEDNECMQSPQYCLGTITTIPLRTKQELIDSPHWCYSKIHRFCSEAVIERSPTSLSS
jgi:hypothetical protein